MNKLFESVDNFFETDNSVLKESSDYCVAMECDRRGYSPSQVIGDTLTVGELVDYLSGLDQDMKIVTSHDNGYTYGAISTSDFRDEPIDSDEDDEYDESEKSKRVKKNLKEMGNFAGRMDTVRAAGDRAAAYRQDVSDQKNAKIRDLFNRLKEIQDDVAELKEIGKHVKLYDLKDRYGMWLDASGRGLDYENSEESRETLHVDTDKILMSEPYLSTSEITADEMTKPNPFHHKNTFIKLATEMLDNYPGYIKAVNQMIDDYDLKYPVKSQEGTNESETSKVKERTLKEDLTNDNHDEIKNKFLEVLDEFTGEYELASEDSKFTPGDDDFNLPEFDLVFDIYHDDNTDNKDNVKAFADKLHSFSKENELDIVAKYLMDDEDMPNILHVNIIPGGDVFVFSIDGDFIYKENYPFDESEKPKVEESVKSNRAERIKALRESVLNRRNNLNVLSESEDPKVNKKISECNFKNYSKMMNKELNSNILNRAGEKPVEDKSL